MWARLASMYTILNLCAVLMIRWLPEFLKDIVRASTLLILVVIVIAFNPQAYGELFDSFAPDYVSIPSSIKMGIMFIADILFHVVPVVLIGLPQVSHSILIAYGILIAWYSQVRERIGEIYSPSVPADDAVRCTGVLALCGAALR